MPRAATPHAWVAIDFETACTDLGSACAVAVVRFAGARRRGQSWLIRPPTRRFTFSDLHGIRWRDVAGEPSFAERWGELRRMLAGAEFIAAHNAAFDRGVMGACCAAAGVRMPGAPWLCTVKLARRAWGVYPTKLPHVARFLGVELDHHDPASDASVCAQAVVRALREGRSLGVALI